MLRTFAADLLKHRLALTGLIILCLLFAMGLFAPWIAPHDPYAVQVKLKLLSPSWEYPLGTDQLGRCILSRLIYGIRTSLTLSVVATLLMLAIGVTLGLLAGYTGRLADNLIMRLADIASTFPSTILALAMIGVLGPSLVNILLVFILLWWAPFARIVRSNVLVTKGQDFVLAAVAAGSSRRQIIWRHLLPSALAPIIVLATLRIASVILHVAGFSFLGLGAQPPVADWGVMLSDSRPYMTSHPLMMLWPGLTIMLSVYCLNLLGEGLNDILLPSSDQHTASEENLA